MVIVNKGLLQHNNGNGSINKHGITCIVLEINVNMNSCIKCDINHFNVYFCIYLTLV